jgi:hypothetical protein
VEFNIWWFVVPYAAAMVYFLVKKGALEKLIAQSKKRRGKAAREREGAAPSPKAQPAKTPKQPERVTDHTQVEFRAGFRDVRWGDAPTLEMTPVKTEGEETLYMRASDVMRLGEGRLSGINYQFWRGRLAGVFIQIAPGSLDRVVEALTALYGRPALPKDGKLKFYWLTLGSGDLATQAMIDGDSERKAGSLVIFSKTIADERKALAAELHIVMLRRPT